MLRRLASAAPRLRASHSSSRMASTLVIADHDNSQIASSTLAAVTAAKKIGDVKVVVAGDNCESAAQAAASIAGVDEVILADSPAFKGFVAENVSSFLENLVKSTGVSHVMAPSGAKGRSVVPRLAALLDVEPISDVSGIESENTYVRPIYAGNAFATVQSSDSVQLLTVRPTAFEKAATEGGSASVNKADTEGANQGISEWVSEELSKSDRPELGSAPIVVSGGRGLKNGENFDILYKLADKIGAAVGASRAAVDAGWVPNDMQVGQTGKVVAPQLYVAVGISGAIQHLAGMKDSKVIVAINKDEEAPIFQVADYGLVDDLFKAVPEMTDKV